MPRNHCAACPGIGVRLIPVSLVALPRILHFNYKTNIARSPQEKYVQVEMREGTETIPMYIYGQLQPGNRIEGPALIVSTDTTIFVNHRDIITVDKYQNLLIDIDKSD